MKSKKEGGRGMAIEWTNERNCKGISVEKEADKYI
jgi:hypothetical protein